MLYGYGFLFTLMALYSVHSYNYSLKDSQF